MKSFLKKLLAFCLLTQLAFGSSVLLTWNAPSPAPNPAITKYKIYKGVCGHETFLTQVNVPTLTYTDAAVQNSQTYCYYVTDVNVNGESKASNEVSVTMPGISCSPSSLTFLRQLVGTPSSSQDTVCTNSTGSTVTIQDDGLGNPGINTNGPFSQTNSLGTLPQTVANNATFTVHVTFTPTAGTTQSGSLTVNSSDGSFVIVPLSGLGAAPIPELPVGLQTDDVTTPNQTRIQEINAAWVNGVAPGYKPGNCGGLKLCIGSGLFGDGTGGTTITIRSYTGASLTMSDNTTNYIYLDHSASFAPAKNTTGFTCPDVPIAEVTTLAGVITDIKERRLISLYCP